ncbi:MAG: tyrosine-type recombinase/integrase [Pseudolabrys sp.]
MRIIDIESLVADHSAPCRIFGGAAVRQPEGRADDAGLDGAIPQGALRRGGRGGASSHSGRRTLITRLAERGIDLKSIAEIEVHAKIRTTAMYVESNPKRLARILQD